MDTWLTTLMFFSLIMVIFEMSQLIVAERYIGIAQIRAREHPEQSSKIPSAVFSTVWLIGIVLSWCYMALLVSHPTVAFQGVCMIFVTMVGFAARRVAGIHYGLIVLTIEGAIRMGLAVNMFLSVYVFSGDERFTWTQRLFE